MATPPLLRMVSATASNRSCRRPVTATLAPQLAKVVANRRPRPDDAPVTSAEGPVRSEEKLGFRLMRDRPGCAWSTPEIREGLGVSLAAQVIAGRRSAVEVELFSAMRVLESAATFAQIANRLFIDRYGRGRRGAKVTKALFDIGDGLADQASLIVNVLRTLMEPVERPPHLSFTVVGGV